MVSKSKCRRGWLTPDVASADVLAFRGPLHFVGSTQRYDMKSSLKHRLLTKQGWQVHHIAWNATCLEQVQLVLPIPGAGKRTPKQDWPEHHHSRMSYIARLGSRSPNAMRSRMFFRTSDGRHPRLLRRPPPGKHLLQYTPLQPSTLPQVCKLTNRKESPESKTIETL